MLEDIDDNFENAVDDAAPLPPEFVHGGSEKGRAREVYLTAQEANALIEVAQDDFKPLLLAAISTGMRRDELLLLVWADVDFSANAIRVWSENVKTSESRSVSMPSGRSGPGWFWTPPSTPTSPRSRWMISRST